MNTEPLVERESRLAAEYLLFDDINDRLTSLVNRGQKWPEAAAHELIPDNAIAQCPSGLWIVGYIVSDRCLFRITAEIPLVKGLAAAICSTYNGASPEEIFGFNHALLHKVQIWSLLSPMRQAALMEVDARIHQFARQSKRPQ